MGSQARREALPSSDVDSAIVWFPDAGRSGARTPADRRASRARLLTVGRTVMDGLARCGLRSDENGVSAAKPAFVRPVDSWQRVARSWLEDPGQEKALVLTSTLLDSRPVWGVHTGTPVADTFRLAPRSSGAAASAGAAGGRAAATDGVPARARRRALRRARRAARSQRGRHQADPGARALGRDRRRRDDRLDARAAARGRGGGHAARRGGRDVARRVLADQQPAAGASGDAAARRASSPTTSSRPTSCRI